MVRSDGDIHWVVGDRELAGFASDRNRSAYCSGNGIDLSDAVSDAARTAGHAGVDSLSRRIVNQVLCHQGDLSDGSCRRLGFGSRGSSNSRQGDEDDAE